MINAFLFRLPSVEEEFTTYGILDFQYLVVIPIVHSKTLLNCPYFRASNTHALVVSALLCIHSIKSSLHGWINLLWV